MARRRGPSGPDALTNGEWKLRGAVGVWVPNNRSGPLTVKSRLRGYSQWRQGVRNDFTDQAFREYQRFYHRAPVSDPA